MRLCGHARALARARVARMNTPHTHKQTNKQTHARAPPPPPRDVSLARFEGKVFSLIHTRFSEAFLLDCDNIPFMGGGEGAPPRARVRWGFQSGVGWIRVSAGLWVHPW